jgi:bifunctional lysine-specific demethylase and histidyl-hydroxylase NO66
VQPLLREGASYDGLLSLSDVDAALSGHGLRRPSVRLVRDGEVIDPTSWTRRVRTGAVTVDDAIDPGRVLDHFASGATVVLQSLHRWWPPIARFCRELETDLGHAVQANAYLTGPRAVGLAPHHDTHDVFVLQLHGTKQWTVREPLVEAPLRRHRSDADVAARQPVRLTAELVPGSCMYLPRGFVHSAQAQEGSSLHLTLGVLATTAADVVRRVAHLAGDHPALRRSLPAGWATDPAMAGQVVKDIVAELVSFVGSLDPDEIADSMAERFAASREPSLVGRLVDLDRLSTLDDRTVITRRDRIGPGVVDAHDQLVRLRTADRTVELPAALAPVVSRLLDGRSRTVGELADALDAPSRLVLVRRLVREGLLTIVTSNDG